MYLPTESILLSGCVPAIFWGNCPCHLAGECCSSVEQWADGVLVGDELRPFSHLLQDHDLGPHVYVGERKLSGAVQCMCSSGD